MLRVTLGFYRSRCGVKAVNHALLLPSLRSFPSSHCTARKGRKSYWDIKAKKNREKRIQMERKEEQAFDAAGPLPWQAAAMEKSRQKQTPNKGEPVSSSGQVLQLGDTSQHPVILEDSNSPPVSPQEFLNQTLVIRPPKPSNKSPKKYEAKRPNRDMKVNPSAASGGVPEPTKDYLQVADGPSTLLETPQHLLVVIDLNGTLLFRPSRDHPKKFIDRPNGRLFLNYCIETFNVVIWSSAKEENVDAMCQEIMTPELRRKCVAIWARGKFNLTPGDYKKRVICFKRLTKLWDNKIIAASHPDHHIGARWDQTNTVLIDDSIEKGRAQPFNLVEVPEWSGDKSDMVLPKVHDYLNFLATHSNVSASLREHPFTKYLAAFNKPGELQPQI